jgi:hypothetical protein
MIDDLEPIGLQRSLSVPISGPKASLKQTSLARAAPGSAVDTVGPSRDGHVVRLDEDEQLLVVFRLAVWICRRPPAVLSRHEKQALLIHAINNMNSLAKTTRSVSSLAQIVQMGHGDLLELCVAILCLGEAKLLQGLQALMTNIAQPPAISHVSRYLEALESEKKPDEDARAKKEHQRRISEVKAFVRAERTKHRDVLKSWI